MKILILNDADENSLGSSYRRAFQALGHETEIVDPLRLLSRSSLWRNRVCRRLLERPLIRRFNRHWLPKLCEEEADLLWVGKGAWALPEFWKSLRGKRPDLTTVCYNADNPITTFSRGGNRPWVTQSIPCFDLFCTYNSSLVTDLREAGARAVAHVPFAWDPEIHPRCEKVPDPERVRLVFVGNGDSHREEWLDAIVRGAPRDWEIAVYGSWPAISAGAAALSGKLRHEKVEGAAMAEVIGGASVAINILREQNHGSHNMRTFEIPGCGGLMASQASAEQERFFPSGEAAIYFTSPSEAVAEIEAAVKNGALEAMRANASSRVGDNTYRHRAEAILQAVGEE